MADFLIAFNRTEKNEGRDVWNIIPGDSGGETWSGIARNKNPGSRIWAIIDAMKPLKLLQVVSTPELQQLKQTLYKQKYWDPINGDGCPNQQLANQMYDEGVNAGDGEAENILKNSLS